MANTTNPGQGETSGQDYNVTTSGCDVNYQNLFMVFAGAAQTCVADQLANDLVSAYNDDTFIVVSGTEFIVHANDTITEIPFRAGTVGFNELTALSHIGPALGYYAELKERDKDITAGIAQLRAAVVGVQSINDAAPTPDYSSGSSAHPDDTYWLNTLVPANNPILADKAAKIQAHITKACNQTLAFIDNYEITYANLYEHFFNNACPKASNGIAYNDVMIATFCLVNSDTGLGLRNNPLIVSIDWANSHIVFTGQSGGISSGLNYGTSSTYASMHAIALDKGVDIKEKVLFAPYLTPGIDSCIHATYDTPADRTAALEALIATYKTRYFNIIARTDVAAKMFDPSTIQQVPQTYPSWETDEISVSILMDRLKTVMLDPRQLLSNSTSSACSQMLVAAGWDASKVEIPGL